MTNFFDLSMNGGYVLPGGIPRQEIYDSVNEEKYDLNRFVYINESEWGMGATERKLLFMSC